MCQYWRTLPSPSSLSIPGLSAVPSWMEWKDTTPHCFLQHRKEGSERDVMTSSQQFIWKPEISNVSVSALYDNIVYVYIHTIYMYLCVHVFKIPEHGPGNGWGGSHKLQLCWEQPATAAHVQFWGAQADKIVISDREQESTKKKCVQCTKLSTCIK